MAAGLTSRRRRLAARYTDFVQRRRDEFCFSAWGLGWLIAWRRGVVPAGLVGPYVGWAEGGIWLLLLLGVGLRVWAAGNLDKNAFTRPRGPYWIVRHPLYAGTLLVSLAFLLSLGGPAVGVTLWLVLLVAVFLPVAAKEERELAQRFPRAYGAYRARVPALLPMPAGLGAAIRTSRFSFARAGRNYGLRAVWFLAVVPGADLLLAEAVSCRLPAP